MGMINDNPWMPKDILMKREFESSQLKSEYSKPYQTGTAVN